MLIVTAHLEVLPGKEAEFIKKTKDLVANTREEAGNISYTLMQNTENPVKFTFLEEWKSKTDLDLHMQTPHFTAFGDISKELTTGDTDIKVFDANPYQ